ncbi:MAG: phosphoribosylformylglycinamidine cyclo-ligase [Planctomycetia bacterium]|nr:phosphoribosylformylglycinamidine cyclo-ligase [Planctomycetia bacterium]
MSKATYKDSGVDLELYRQAMSRLPAHMNRTETPRVRRLPGGFAGLFQLDFEKESPFRRNYEDPVLISCTDGVGTKLKIAVMMDRHTTVGIDLVAMSVNDAICCGAEPLFFLDYVAMGKDQPVLLEQIVSGISDGCVQAGCALLGGETAIMPDMYAPEDYDLGGFCVGVASRKEIIDGQTVKPGDVVLGVASNGLHSNGFSLVRKVVFEMAGLNVGDTIEKTGTALDGRLVGDVLLEPTKIYVRPVLNVLETCRTAVHGIAHITGGGLFENLERVLPEGVQVRIAAESWEIPPVFQWLQKLGDIQTEEMFQVFNMGLGLVLIVEPEKVATIQTILQENGLSHWTIGSVTAGNRGVVWNQPHTC